jgi:hypothetical protein
MCTGHGISEELKQEIMKISQIIIKQNNFQFQNTLCIQEELAMGAPTSSIFSEIYLLHIENTMIRHFIKIPYIFIFPLRGLYSYSIQ